MRRSNNAVFDRRDWLLLPLLIAVHLLLLGADGQLRFYMGDSQTFVAAAVMRVASTHRSFVYSEAIHYLGPQTLLVLQVLAGSITAFLAAVALRCGFGTGRALAWGSALVVALAPLQLLYQRYLLAESFALLTLAGMLTCALLYLRTPRAALLFGAAILATLTVSLRGSALPSVFAVFTATLLLAWLSRARGTRLRFALRHALPAIALLAACQSGYAVLYGLHAKLPPAQQYEGGLFALAAISPLLQAEDFPDPVFGKALLAACGPLTRDRRELQRWSPQGLVETLWRSRQRDLLLANRIAAETVGRTLRRDPLGVARHMLTNYAEYLTPAALRLAGARDREELAPLPAGFVDALKHHYGLEVAADAQVKGRGWAGAWHALAWPWYVVLGLSPLLMAVPMAAARDGTARGQLLVLTAGAVALVATTAFFSTIVVIRYLQPLEWLLAVALGAGLQPLWKHFRPDGEGVHRRDLSVDLLQANGQISDIPRG